jgi:DNA-binding SARP family transcriptional activator/Flp pilus assembly protein TadD
VAAESEFCLLGPLLVRQGGAVTPVTRGKERAVLAALLLGAGRAVSLDELAETLWGAGPPPSARVTLQNYVRRLRKILADTGGSRIRTLPHGYLMSVAAGELDVSRFAALQAAAREAARERAWDRAAAQLRAALSLWRGEPLADVPSQLLALREVPRLTEMRLQAVEARIDADLHLGDHGAVLGELRQLAAVHPLRERLHALLMLALWRDGQQAEALAAYQRARRILIDELGVEPGPELRRLEHQILTADPALAASAPAQAGSGPGPASAGSGPGDAGAGGGPRAPTVSPAAGAVVPRLLPAPAAHFAGRQSELTALSRLLGEDGAQARGTVVISAIGGTAGVGKTALALHWAHRVADLFPDGQLYVNLRGFDPSGTPVTPADAVRRFLDALQVPASQIPSGPEARQDLYRSLLAGRRMLIVLDNARDAAQVRPLLPGGMACLVLVTSRSQLTSMVAAQGAHPVTLDVLSPAEASEMLECRLGPDRIAAEPEAATELTRLCAYLPLALAIAAARAAFQPGQPLAALVAELRDASGRLDALDVGDPGSSVRAVFSWSYRQLTGQAARMFRLLGIHPGPDITVPAAASLTGIPEADARRLLGELTRAHLTAQHAPGRYAFHDLLRAYAAEQSRHTDSDTGRREATRRVLDHYLHTAARAAFLLVPSKEPVVLAPPGPGAAAGQLPGQREALAWFEAEHQVLLAVVTLATRSGLDTYAWQLPWAMASFLQARGHWQEWAATQRRALAAATRLHDAAAQALSGRLLAMACANLGDHDQARGHYASSLALYQRLGNRLGEAKVQQSLSVLANGQGCYADALAHVEQALRLYRAIGDEAGEAEALNNVGWCHGLLGDYQRARTFCRQALTLSAGISHRRNEGHAWDTLGYAEHHLGNLAEAAACYQRALSLHREAGDRFSEADALTHLGDTRHAAGELPLAKEVWQQALAILDDIQHPDAGQVRFKLASTKDHDSSNPPA